MLGGGYTDVTEFFFSLLRQEKSKEGRIRREGQKMQVKEGRREGKKEGKKEERWGERGKEKSKKGMA